MNRWLIVARVGVTLWAVFWMWFVVAQIWSEGKEGLPYAAGGLLVLGALVLCAWWRAKVGGVLLAVFGVFAAFFFEDAMAFALLAAPAMLLGAILIAASHHRRRGGTLSSSSR